MSVAWRWDGATFSLDVELPPNTSAEVRMPGRDARAAFVIDSGHHSFTSPLGAANLQVTTP
jgi:alpha-L-rhamnosidase